MALRVARRYGAAMNTIVLGAAAALAAAVLALAAPAGAARRRVAHTEPEAAATRTLGSAGAWSAYIAHNATGRVCYLAGQPQKSASADIPRDQPMAMVTHRPAEHIADVVSFVEGYTLKPGSAVTLKVGDRTFDLFTDGDSAWAKTSELDRTIVAALARGATVVAKGEAANGRMTTDIYSLDGFAKALALIDKACGVSREIEPPRHHPPLHHPPHRSRRRPVHRKPPPPKRPSAHKPAEASPPKPSD